MAFRLLKNRHLFAFSDSDLLVTDLMEAHIDTKDTPPINLRPYRTPLNKRQFVSESIDHMLDAGLISRTNSGWNFPIVIVTRKSEDPNVPPKERMCIDFRKLNAACVLESQNIPRIDDILGELRGSTFFTSLDLRSGFHQIKLSPEASQKCSFSCHKGKFKYNVLPMGLKTPLIFSRR